MVQNFSSAVSSTCKRVLHGLSPPPQKKTKPETNLYLDTFLTFIHYCFLWWKFKTLVVNGIQTRGLSPERWKDLITPCKDTPVFGTLLIKHITITFIHTEFSRNLWSILNGDESMYLCKNNKTIYNLFSHTTEFCCCFFFKFGRLKLKTELKIFNFQICLRPTIFIYLENLIGMSIAHVTAVLTII